MISISKNAYIDKLADIINKYKNPYHGTITYSTYIDFNKYNNKEDPRFEFGDQIRILKYKNIIAKSYVPNCSAEDFVIKKLKMLFRRYMLLVILMVKKLLERFTKKNYKKKKTSKRA